MAIKHDQRIATPEFGQYFTSAFNVRATVERLPVAPIGAVRTDYKISREGYSPYRLKVEAMMRKHPEWTYAQCRAILTRRHAKRAQGGITFQTTRNSD